MKTKELKAVSDAVADMLATFKQGSKNPDEMDWLAYSLSHTFERFDAKFDGKAFRERACRK